MIKAPRWNVFFCTRSANHKDFLEIVFRLFKSKSHISEIDNPVELCLAFLDSIKHTIRIRTTTANEFEVRLFLLLSSKRATHTIPETVGHIGMFYEFVHNGTPTFHIFVGHRTRAVNGNEDTGAEFMFLTRNIKCLATVGTHTGIFSVLIHSICLESLQDRARVKFGCIGSKNSLEQTTTNVTPLRSTFSNVVSDFLDFLVNESIFFPTFGSLFCCLLCCSLASP